MSERDFYMKLFNVKVGRCLVLWGRSLAWFRIPAL